MRGRRWSFTYRAAEEGHQCGITGEEAAKKGGGTGEGAPREPIETSPGRVPISYPCTRLVYLPTPLYLQGAELSRLLLILYGRPFHQVI